MTEIKLDIDTALSMLGKTREYYEERKAWNSKDCLFNKTNVDKIQNCVLNNTEEYFGITLENIIGFDKKSFRRNIKMLLMKPEENEPSPIILGTVTSRPRPNCKFLNSFHIIKRGVLLFNMIRSCIKFRHVNLFW